MSERSRTASKPARIRPESMQTAKAIGGKISRKANEVIAAAVHNFSKLQSTEQLATVHELEKFQLQQPAPTAAA